MLDATTKVVKAGIKPEFVKFVASEVLGQVSDTLDFDTALKAYKAKNPQFNSETAVVKRKVGSSLKLDGRELNNERFNTFCKRLVNILIFLFFILKEEFYHGTNDIKK